MWERLKVRIAGVLRAALTSIETLLRNSPAGDLIERFKLDRWPVWTSTGIVLLIVGVHQLGLVDRLNSLSGPLNHSIALLSDAPQQVLSRVLCVRDSQLNCRRDPFAIETPALLATSSRIEDNIIERFLRSDDSNVQTAKRFAEEWSKSLWEFRAFPRGRYCGRFRTGAAFDLHFIRPRSGTLDPNMQAAEELLSTSLEVNFHGSSPVRNPARIDILGIANSWARLRKDRERIAAPGDFKIEELSVFQSWQPGEPPVGDKNRARSLAERLLTVRDDWAAEFNRLNTVYDAIEARRAINPRLVDLFISDRADVAPYSAYEREAGLMTHLIESAAKEPINDKRVAEIILNVTENFNRLSIERRTVEYRLKLIELAERLRLLFGAPATVEGVWRPVKLDPMRSATMAETLNSVTPNLASVIICTPAASADRLTAFEIADGGSRTLLEVLIWLWPNAILAPFEVARELVGRDPYKLAGVLFALTFAAFLAFSAWYEWRAPGSRHLKLLAIVFAVPLFALFYSILLIAVSEYAYGWIVWLVGATLAVLAWPTVYICTLFFPKIHFVLNMLPHLPFRAAGALAGWFRKTG